MTAETSPGVSARRPAAAGRIAAAGIAVVAAIAAGVLTLRTHRMGSAENALAAVRAIADAVRAGVQGSPDGRFERSPAWQQLVLPTGFRRGAELTSPWGAEVNAMVAGRLIIVDLHAVPPALCVPLMQGAATIPGMLRVAVNTMAADERPVAMPAGVAEADCRKHVEIIRFIASLDRADGGSGRRP
jgi:hypothetical protein